MADNQNNTNRKPSPNGKGKDKKPKSVLRYVYIGLGVVLLALWLAGNNTGGPTDITWTELEPILLRQDEAKIVVVNQSFAEVHIKQEVLKSDTTYAKLKGKGAVEPSFYKYEFVNIESFQRDLERVEQQLITQDTMGRSQELSYEALTRIQKDAHIILIPEQRSNRWKEILYLCLPMLIIFAFFFLTTRSSMKGMGGGGGIFNVGKSKAKLYDGKKPTNITFKDVAGLAGAKEEVMEVVDFLKNPKRYTDLGGKIPKGVLLVGPPGTGKTLLAKAVAGEANVPFFSMSGSDFVEMFVGVGASRVRDLFDEAKKKSPCIIFIDEIDAVGRARGRSGLSNANDERENTLNQLLTEMDGFTTNTGVIVLAATNRADVLDKALLRAGRFDRQIYVELPDLEERKGIFEVHMKRLKLADDVDRDFLAKQTPGFSGADIANVCNESALVAARKAKKQIEKQDFLDAIDRIVGGLEKRTKVLSDQEKRTIAYHESGHASVSWLLRWGDPLVKVTIVPRGKALGAAWYLPEERQLTTREQMLHSMTSLMAGRAAEEVVFGAVSTGALNDMERATKMAQSMVMYYGMSPKIGNLSFYDSTGAADWNFTKPFSEVTAQAIDDEVKALVEGAYAEAKALIESHRAQIDELANTLYEREVIFKEDVERIFGARPWDAPALAEGDAAEQADMTLPASTEEADNAVAPSSQEADKAVAPSTIESNNIETSANADNNKHE